MEDPSTIAPSYEPSPIEASLDPWPSIAFSPPPEPEPQPEPTYEAPAPAYEAPVYEAPAVAYSAPEESFLEPVVIAQTKTEEAAAKPAPFDAFELEIEPTTISWPRPLSKDGKKKDAAKKEPKRRWGLPLPAAPAQAAEPATFVAPAVEIEPVQFSQADEFDWDATDAIQGFQYNTPAFSMSLPSANDSRLPPAIGKRGIIALCVAPIAIVLLLIFAVSFIGTSEKPDTANTSSTKANKDATATTLAGGWVNYSDPGGKFSGQLPSQPKVSQVSSSDGPVSVWSSSGNGGHMSAVVVIGPLPPGTDPKSQDPMNNAAKNAASSAGMTIKGQFVKTDDGVTHLDALMTNTKASSNVRFFISGNTLIGLSISTDDQTNDPAAFNTLTRTFKIGNGTPVHGAEAAATTAAPTTTAAVSSNSSVASWSVYKEPSGLFSIQMPGKPTVNNTTEDGQNATTWISEADAEAAEVSLVKFPAALSGQITESALKQALTTKASEAGMTINSQSTSTANGAVRINAVLSNAQAKVQLRMIAQGANIYQLSLIVPKSTSDDTLNKNFTAYASSFKLGQAS